VGAPELPPGGFPGAAEELRRQEAFDAAWRFLGHRDRTEAEVRRNFTRKRVDPELVEEVVSALLEGGYLDDAAFAHRFAEDRRNLDGWGAERIDRRLAELGVDRAHIRAALAGEEGHDELAAACELLARRFPVPPDTPRELERALGFLVRKGYELELAHDALRRHAAAAVEN
jgi:regulatory protein